MARKKLGAKSLEIAAWIEKNKHRMTKKELYAAPTVSKTKLADATLDRARVVLNSGIPALITLVKEGNLTLTPAANIARMSPADQQAAVQSILMGHSVNYAAYASRLTLKQSDEFLDHIQKIKKLTLKIQSCFDQHLYSEYLIEKLLKQLLLHLNAIYEKEDLNGT